MKILIIDDIKEARQNIIEFLKQNNINTDVEEASNGNEAIEKFKKGNFKFVLIDIGLPDIDGREVLKKIKQIKQKTKIIIISGYNDKYLESIKAGAEYYLTKPLNYNKLLEIIKNG